MYMKNWKSDSPKKTGKNLEFQKKTWIPNKKKIQFVLSNLRSNNMYVFRHTSTFSLQGPARTWSGFRLFRAGLGGPGS